MRNSVLASSVSHWCIEENLLWKSDKRAAVWPLCHHTFCSLLTKNGTFCRCQRPPIGRSFHLSAAAPINQTPQTSLINGRDSRHTLPGQQHITQSSAAKAPMCLTQIPPHTPILVIHTYTTYHLGVTTIHTSNLYCSLFPIHTII